MWLGGLSCEINRDVRTTSLNAHGYIYIKVILGRTIHIPRIELNL